MSTEVITEKELKEELSYNPLTGVFLWIKPKRGRRLGNAGNTRPDGYMRIGIKYRSYLAHRLAWLYMTGQLPVKMIDHIDGNPSNNAFANLREADDSINHENLRSSHKDSESGLLGVSFHARDRLWRARIYADGKNITIGHFKNKEDAHKAYIDAKRNLHAGCTI
jgi:hypothetical protein